jgi:L-alanine-DL-glutamate epimerase-like enolase superfamily enzyme
MKVTRVESLHADGGWRTFSFLKVSTDNGIVGWSEYNACYGSVGLPMAIDMLAPRVVGKNPLAIEAVAAELYAATRQSPGGVVQQAIGAIENALLDVKGKVLGVPVYALLGGPLRNRLRLYWSHCGTTRLYNAEAAGVPPVRTLKDVVALGKEVREKGFTALKTNLLILDHEPAFLHMPGFARGTGWPELNAEPRLIASIRKTLEAFREGAGTEMEILLDLNFNFKTEGFLKVARALDDLGLFWFEIDNYDAPGLRLIRNALRTPIASCESLHGFRQFLPFFEHRAMDVAIIDEVWNGVALSHKIAAAAEAYEINIAPHNFYGHLSTLMSAHLCAAVPNFRIMEIDVDDVPWKDELVSPAPVIQDGHLLLPTSPGWGAEVNEEAVRAHPPKRPFVDKLS